MIYNERRLALFDWSGTLSDDRMPVYNANMKILAEHEIPAISFSEFLSLQSSNPVEFCRHYGIVIDSKEAMQRFERYFTEVAALVAPHAYEGAVDVLKKAKSLGAIIGIVSSHPAEKIDHEARHYGLRNFIDFIEGGSVNKTVTLQVACSKQDARPSQTIYIGDMTSDIGHARAAGVRPVAVCHGYHSREMLEKELASCFIFDDLIALNDGTMEKMLRNRR